MDAAHWKALKRYLRDTQQAVLAELQILEKIEDVFRAQGRAVAVSQTIGAIREIELAARDGRLTDDGEISDLTESHG